MKFCASCNSEKSENEFHKDKSRKDGLHITCKECRSKAGFQFRLDNAEKMKISGKISYQKRKDYYKQYYQKTATIRSEYYKAYYREKSDKIKENSKRYWENNKAKITERRKNNYNSLHE